MDSKQCPSCMESINIKAKQCPHCQTYQSTFKRFLKDPLGGTFIGVVIALLLVSWFFENRFSNNAIYDSATGLQVSETTIQFVDASCGQQVSVVGIIENVGTEILSDIVFDIEFYDTNGTLIDAFSDTEYDLVLLHGAQKKFKILGDSGAKKELYESHKISIAKAEPDSWL